MQTNVLHLLHFSIIQTSANMIDTLIEESPSLMGVEIATWFDDSRSFDRAQHYLMKVRVTLGRDTDRQVRYIASMNDAEIEAERAIRLIPPSERPHHDHLLLLQYNVAHLQFIRTRLFLIGERNNIKDQLLSIRPLLIDMFGKLNK